jgi:penicillin-binding protein 1A
MEQKEKFRKYRKYLWWAALSPLLLIVFIMSLISLGVFGDVPDIEEIENPRSNLASEVISSDTKLLGTYFVENRSQVDYKSLSPHLVHALVATEDERFYDHSGIDAMALSRVLFKTVLLFQKNSGGGSTITQQTAKMLFDTRESLSGGIVVRKLAEWMIAVKLERHYTKEEILAMYLNRFDFINGAVGVKMASSVYFNTSPDSLRIEQAALLVGMAKNPALFNPVRRPDTTMHRRNVVLGQMLANDLITKSQFDSLKTLPIGLQFKSVDHNQGLATYFREYLRTFMLDWCKHHLKPDGKKYDLYRDGLKIYTTIDSRMQRHAETAVTEHLSKLQDEFFAHWKDKPNAPFFNMNQADVDKLMRVSMKRSERYMNLKEAGMSDAEITKEFNKKIKMRVFSWKGKGEFDTLMSPMDSMHYYKYFLQTGLMSMDPTTGFVKAWVGGINYKHFKYDHVKTGRRQVGSTFKPFVYAVAMQEGYSPCYRVPNIPVTFVQEDGTTWSPSNADDKHNGEMVSLKFALANSINYISAWVIKQFRPQAVVDLVKKMGITTEIEPVPSICLGTPDISVFEMVGANSTFVNKGVWTEPTFITRIEDKNGNVIQEFSPETKDALDENTAYATLSLMEGVVQFGTGARIRNRFKIPYPVAGKTGTTQNNSDGWFMGLTPDLVSGVWVGCEDRSVHFRSTFLGQGANTALPIWGLYMQKVYADSTIKISRGGFDSPKGPFKIELDCKKFDAENNFKQSEYDDSSNDEGSGW